MPPKDVLLWHDSAELGDCRNGRHTVEVVGVRAQLDHLGNEEHSSNGK